MLDWRFMAQLGTGPVDFVGRATRNLTRKLQFMGLMPQPFFPDPLLATSDELVDWDPQCFGQPRHNDDGRISRAALDAADVGPVQAGFEGEFLLRPAPLLPDPLEIASNLPPDVHRDSRPICRLIVYRR